jgi:hypothetical protein
VLRPHDMIVTLDQLKRKLQTAALMKAELEAEGQRNGGKLARSDIWRLQYFTDPYLIGAHDERLSDRFRDIFLNMMDLTEEGKLTLRDLSEEINFVWKFQDIQEEYGLRGGLFLDIIQRARARILSYFDNSGPVAKRIFSDYKIDNKKILVKYGKEEHLASLFNGGSLRICPASYYGDASLNDAVRDDEISRSFIFPTYNERQKGAKCVEINGTKFEMRDSDIIIRRKIEDYYMFCLSKSVYYRLPTDFQADAALIIHDLIRFEQAVISNFLNLYPEFEPLSGEIVYYDPYRDYDKVHVPELSKQFEYAYQREYRIIFKSKIKKIATPEPLQIKVGNIKDYCTLLVA